MTITYTAYVYDRTSRPVHAPLVFAYSAEAHAWRTERGYVIPTATSEWSTLDGSRYVNIRCVARSGDELY